MDEAKAIAIESRMDRVEQNLDVLSGDVKNAMQVVSTIAANQKTQADTQKDLATSMQSILAKLNSTGGVNWGWLIGGVSLLYVVLQVFVEPGDEMGHKNSDKISAMISNRFTNDNGKELRAHSDTGDNDLKTYVDSKFDRIAVEMDKIEEKLNSRGGWMGQVSEILDIPRNDQ